MNPGKTNSEDVICLLSNKKHGTGAHHSDNTSYSNYLFNFPIWIKKIVANSLSHQTGNFAFLDDYLVLYTEALLHSKLR